jgi:hypothetical protein
MTSTGVILVVSMARSKKRRAALASRRWGDEHVDDLAELVDRTVDVAPPTGDLCVALIGLPAIADGVAAWPGGIDQQRREPLDPAVDGGMVDLDPAVGEQLLDVAIGQPKAQVPANRQHDHVRWKAEAGEGRSCERSSAERRGLMATVCLPAAPSQQMHQRHLRSWGPVGRPAWCYACASTGHVWLAAQSSLSLAASAAWRRCGRYLQLTEGGQAA